jgi:lysophospholipase L1-like esterase
MTTRVHPLTSLVSTALLIAVASTTLVVSACDESPTSATSTTTSGSNSGGAGTPTTGTNLTLTATRFLAFGDSMTAGEVTAPMGATSGPMAVVPAASFPSQLQARLRARYPRQAGELVVTNAGRPGELIGSALPRLAEILANSQTQAVLFCHGYNDLLDFGAGAVNPAIARYDALAKEARRRGARVFIALLPPPIAGRQRSVPDSVVRDFNGGLRQIAAGEGAVVVDLYTALSADVGRYIGVDGHHPTEAGYARIAEEFALRIAAELEPR